MFYLYGYHLILLHNLLREIFAFNSAGLIHNSRRKNENNLARFMLPIPSDHALCFVCSSLAKEFAMKKLLAALILTTAALPAMAQRVIGGSLYILNPAVPVEIKFVRTNSAATHILSLAGMDAYGNLVSPWQDVFRTGYARSGETVAVYVRGVELSLRLYNQRVPNSYYSGSASRNPDRIPHVAVSYGYLGPGTAYVTFEDQYQGGDRDYDDAIFVVSNVAAAPPLPPPPVFVPVPKPVPVPVAVLPPCRYGYGWYGWYGGGNCRWY